MPLVDSFMEDERVHRQNLADAINNLTFGNLSKKYVSPAQTITAAGALTLAHGLELEPQFVSVELVCVSADVGFTAGAAIPYHLGSQGNDAGQSNSGIVVNKTGSQSLVVRFGQSASPATILILHATTGVLTGITNDNWNVIFRAYA